MCGDIAVMLIPMPPGVGLGSGGRVLHARPPRPDFTDLPYACKPSVLGG